MEYQARSAFSQKRIGSTVRMSRLARPILDHVRGQEHAHRLDVRTAALHQIPGVGAVEELGPQVVQPPKQFLAQALADRLGGHRRPEPAEEQEEAAHGGDEHARRGRRREVGEVGVRGVEGFGDGHERRRAHPEVAFVHDVDGVLADERRAEHQHVRQRHRDDGAGVPDALSPGDGPEAGSFLHVYPSDEVGARGVGASQEEPSAPREKSLQLREREGLAPRKAKRVGRRSGVGVVTRSAWGERVRSRLDSATAHHGVGGKVFPAHRSSPGWWAARARHVTGWSGKGKRPTHRQRARRVPRRTGEVRRNVEASR